MHEQYRYNKASPLFNFHLFRLQVSLKSGNKFGYVYAELVFLPFIVTENLEVLMYV